MINKENLDRIALITRDKKVSYGEIFREVNKYDQLFKGKSYTKVAILSENREEWVYAFYAAWQNDCVVIPVDFVASVDDVSYILNDCQPEAIFISPDKKEDFKKVQAKLTYELKAHVFTEIDLSQDTNNYYWEGPKDSEKTAVIIYTSGTTGSPKGVMLSFRNLEANITAVHKEVKIYRPDQEVLMLLPLHHIFPLAGSMMAPLLVGGTIVMAPSMQSSELMETLKNNKVSMLIGVPRLYELIYKGIKAKIDASFVARTLFKLAEKVNSQSFSKKIFKKVHQGLGGNVDYFVSGGAALDKIVGQFFTTLGFEILEGFGMTEAAPMITFTRPGSSVIGSTGQALPSMQVEIRDGEVVAKGPNVMQGYYNRPEETSEVLKDGWLYTGDLGNIDEKGFLRITGRKKEIIVLSNGKNINPVEIEMKLERNFEGIKEVGVFLHENQLHAIFVPDFAYLTANRITEPEKYFKNKILTDYNKESSSYKRIMQFTLSKEDLPRTRLSKIQRFKLAELITKPKEEKKVSSENQSEEFVAVKTYLESQVDIDIHPDHHIEFDIALDSLGKVGLLDFIDKSFGVKMEEDLLMKFPSIQKMVDHIRDNKLWQKYESINWTEALKERVNVSLPKTWITQNIITGGANWLFKLYFKFKGDGIKNLPEGPCIIAPNHQSYFDGLFVASFLRFGQMRKTYFYAKKKHVNNWFLKLMARKNNVIVMDLNKDLKGSIQKMAEVLKRGRKIIIFPEGTRTKDGTLGEFKKTFAILSKELNVPVVPVAINGAYDALPRGSRFPKPFTNIKVDFLKPVNPGDYSLDALKDKVQDLIDQKLRK